MLIPVTLPEPEMTMRPVALGELGGMADLALRGPDREIATLGALNTRSVSTSRMLTYISDPGLIGRMDELGIAACVVHESLAETLDGRSLLVARGDPVEAFYGLLIETANAGLWQQLEAGRGENVSVAPTAVVHEHVQLGDDCVLMDHVVVLPNTRIGDRVTIKPNTTIGGDGFQVTTIDARPVMVPHCGGVWLGDDVQVGSQTCIDRGMFGEFTVVGDGTKIDNLIHIAHSVHLGPGGVVAASSEMGNITAGEGFWLAPQCAVLQDAHIGHHAYIGLGSVVVKEIQPHALAYGVPARQHGWVCSCREQLEFEHERARCSRCGRSWEQVDSGGIAEAGAA